MVSPAALIRLATRSASLAEDSSKAKNSLKSPDEGKTIVRQLGATSQRSRPERKGFSRHRLLKKMQ
jgi:hypothetical protein